MTNLISGLERIRNKLTEYVPDRASELRCGLLLEEIEETFRSLPFGIPSEVCELYQWRDGLFANFLFENYEFLPLKSAVYSYQEELAQAQADRPEIAEFFQYRFPLFQLWSDSGVLLTVVPNEQGGSPIYGYDVECEDYSLRYDSLTQLILHAAEWYETAPFIEQDNELRIYNAWKIDPESAYWLDVKYMARERIVRVVNMRGGGLRQSIYQRFLDENNLST
jgi:hypothetical protein